MLEVLAARHRLGETRWPFERTHLRTLRQLQDRGLIGYKRSNIVGKPEAWLTDTGRDIVFWANYQPPTPPVPPNLPPLRREVNVTWSLYNAAEQSSRMTLTRGQYGDVYTIDDARRRMAPYAAEGWEVVERRYEYWITDTRLIPNPGDPE